MPRSAGRHLAQRTRSGRRRSIVAGTALILAIGLPLGVVANHRFTDVTNSNIFHDDVTWLADHDVTRGCNPPGNTRFCPKDEVTREQMAAFMRRFAQNFGTAGEHAFAAIAGPAGAVRQVASVNVVPKGEVGVVLNGMAVLNGASGRSLYLSKDSCLSELVIGWITGSEGTPSVTLRDVISEPTTYSLCTWSPSAYSVSTRSLTAFWAPTG